MGLFIALIVAVFTLLGRGLSAVREHPVADEADERLLWGLGVALAAHVSNWFGITYFDQFQVFWLLQLSAMIVLSREAMDTDEESEVWEHQDSADLDDGPAPSRGCPQRAPL